MNTDRLFSQAGNLPAYQIADAVNQKLAESSNLVITAPPGAGKSTLLPLTILNACNGKILMLEPRRLAARQIAERMASIWANLLARRLAIVYASKIRRLKILASKFSLKESSRVC